MRLLGIQEIEHERAIGNARADGIFVADLETLERLRTTYHVDLQHLESRHQFFMAIVEAGPYAIITSVVALGWALASEETVIAPTAAIAVILAVLVALCNRLDNAVENSMVKAKLGLSRINERYSIRERDVEAAYEEYNMSRATYLDGYLSVNPSRYLDNYRTVIQNLIPSRDGQLARNMKYRHPDTFRLMEDLEKTAIEYFDCEERFRRKARSLMEDMTDEKTGGRKTEEWLDETARVLIYCLNNSIHDTDDMKRGMTSRRIDRGWTPDVARIFAYGYGSCLDDQDLKEIAHEMELHRESAARLAANIGREISVLYSGKKRTEFSPGVVG
jgi:hypothetical protein